MIKLKMKYLKETKTCTVFQSGTRDGNDLLTLYLKKDDVKTAGIDPAKGITVTVE
jgi:hypothetical protein